MRELLYWTVKRERYSKSIFTVMRVTRISRNNTRINGSVNGISCHCVAEDIFGEFKTEEEAAAACVKIADIWASFAAEEDRIYKERKAFEWNRESVVNAYLKTLATKVLSDANV